MVPFSYGGTRAPRSAPAVYRDLVCCGTRALRGARRTRQARRPMGPPRQTDSRTDAATSCPHAHSLLRLTRDGMTFARTPPPLIGAAPHCYGALNKRQYEPLLNERQLFTAVDMKRLRMCRPGNFWAPETGASTARRTRDSAAPGLNPAPHGRNRLAGHIRLLAREELAFRNARCTLLEREEDADIFLDQAQADRPSLALLPSIVS